MRDGFAQLLPFVILALLVSLNSGSEQFGPFLKVLLLLLLQLHAPVAFHPGRLQEQL
jgi:hypothetical protein